MNREAETGSLRSLLHHRLCVPWFAEADVAIIKMVEKDMEMLCWQFPSASEKKYLRIFVIGLRVAHTLIALLSFYCIQ